MQRIFWPKTVFLTFATGAVFAIVIAVKTIFPGVPQSSDPAARTFLEQFVVSGGPIVWFVLLPMSLITVYLTAELGLSICRKNLLPPGNTEMIKLLLLQDNPLNLKSYIADRQDLVSIALVKALGQYNGDLTRMREIVCESLTEQVQGFLRRVEWLSLMGNISPMVGLFGTVFGMIKLFNAIVISGGQPQPAQLAGGISVALVTTFWGLLIAIPALAVHSILKNRIESLTADAAEEIENILVGLISHLKKNKPSSMKPISGPAKPATRLIELPPKAPKSSYDRI